MNADVAVPFTATVICAGEVTFSTVALRGTVFRAVLKGLIFGDVIETTGKATEKGGV
jgi:hypothetical protein